SGYTYLVLFNGREYKIDLLYKSSNLAYENTAIRAYTVCRSLSVNGGMPPITGSSELPADNSS
ncbi:hypothetical protein B0T24DRAFT_533252, partial [Lasiosphaeria ovina]